MRPFFPSLLLTFALMIGCGHKPSETSEPEKHYALSGSIVSLDPKNQTASIDAAAIPNYMDAMTMDYPIKSAAEFKTLHVGDKIKATLNVTASGSEYYVTNVQKQSSGTK